MTLYFSQQTGFGLEYKYSAPKHLLHLKQIYETNNMKLIKEYTLDFCGIKYRDDGIVELEIAEGVDVDAAMATQLTEMADEVINMPFGMLSNRVNSYSLSFEAMSILANYDNIAALAIVVHSARSRMLVETQNFFISAIKKKPIKIFMDYQSANTWLHTTLLEIQKNN